MSIRGETEQQCLDRIKSNVDSIQFFGFDTGEEELVKRIIKNAIPNEDLNAFPDFVALEGIIEHFEVNAAKSTGKGSIQKAEISRQNRLYEIQKDLLKFPYSQEYIEKELKVFKYPIAFSNPTQTYESLCENIKNSFQKHCRSLANYISVHQKTQTAFLIELQYDLFYMRPKSIATSDDGIDDIYGYKLSKDKNMLQYFYLDKNDVDYIILANNSDVEIIKISAVPEIVKEIPFEYDICLLGRLVTIHDDDIV